ncbi:DNA polymerase alpha/epsilon, subunit B [Cordyceps fumosorosea ARSEF 2679]|uniref:DNA polymerase epsilon subunit B n=1 Tax=Cordyceps fumosorosea (strain ARSEF 2679) TaxID=1081104 RepID=A0A162LEN3_CORFA|nr:DNA polymerase alpha/epsilon, subunit B [Cordyceps fumosorosea ARSEF 2679]OAA69574.1 DNA polymerase alpha/epsilon, subunit B [Cordyceps fumosorosea ARSEF 2679]
MSGGKLVSPGKGLPRGDSMLDIDHGDSSNTRLGVRPKALMRVESNTSFGMSGLQVQEGDEDTDELHDPRAWLKVIDAFEQPRLFYNVENEHFERDTTKPSLLPQASHKTAAFRDRYEVIHQRLLRNESFKRTTVSASRTHGPQTTSNSKNMEITPIANMLGRHGSNHLLLGQLNNLSTGELAISDLTGTIALNLDKAITIPDDSTWFCPGMIVLVDGVYEEEEESVGRGLGGGSGVGGTLGGRFKGFFIGHPLCESRQTTMGITGPEKALDDTIGGGFGWIDFLGVGSERAVGQKMRRLERRLLTRAAPAQPLSLEEREEEEENGGTEYRGDRPPRGRIVIIGELNIDQARVLHALRKILEIYSAEPDGSAPVAFVLAGNFTQDAVLSRGGGGSSIEYKECFDALASTLSDYPKLLRSSTFIFVPGDNDGWVSSFTAGASTPVPRQPVPDMFTSRVRRAFATANAEAGPSAAARRGGGVPGTAVWTSNPSRISLFGPNHDIVLFRDDISARLHRTSVHLTTSSGGDGDGDDVAATAESMDVDREEPEVAATATAVPWEKHAARKLVKTLLDQGHLSPFPTSTRPVHWDFAAALQLYPLPTAVVLVDTTTAPFCVTYEGCHVMNPGAVAAPGRKSIGRWIEYELGGVGRLRECPL